MITWENKCSNSDNNQCRHDSQLRIFEIHDVAAVKWAALTSNNWEVSFNIHSQQLSTEADMTSATVSVEMLNDVANDDAVISAEKWAQQEHADLMYMIHSDNHDMIKHLLHDAMMQ